MSTMRLLTRVAPLAIALAVFLFGTQLTAQTTYTWNPTTADVNGDYLWTEVTNWTSTGGTYPGDGTSTTDVVVFDGTAATTPPKLSSTTLTIAEMRVDGDQELELDRALTVNTAVNLSGGKTLKLIRNVAAGQLTVSGKITFNTGSTIVGDGSAAEPGKIYLSGTVDMGNNPTSNNTTHFGDDLLTVIGNKNFMLSDVVFLDDINITGIAVELSGHNIYLSKDADVINGLTWGVANAEGSTVGFFACAGGNDDQGQGRVCKEFDSMSDPEFTFPVGPVGERYTPISIKIDCANPSTISTTSAFPFPNINVRVVLNKGTSEKGHPANENSSEVWLYWVVKGDGLPTESYPLTNSIGFSGQMMFHQNYRSGNTSQLFSAVYYPHNEDSNNPDNTTPPFSGAWFRNGSVTSTITSDAVTVPFGKPNNSDCTIGFGDYSCGVVGEILPVELTSFSARYYMDDNAVQLKWLTATEENNLGFWVERSTDGEKWETLPDFVQGAGNSSVPLSYEFTDRLDDRITQAPKIAYRLRQVDRDGTIDYSSIVYVYTGSRPETVELYEAYPNPFNPSTTLSFSIEESSNVTLRVYNTLGMEVATLLNNRSMDAGFHNIEFNGNDLMSGVYIAVLEAAGTIQQQKLVLSK